MTLKIVGGSFRGRTLVSPRGSAVRPTSARLRETVFNILQGEIEGASFLDVFCGSGAMGLEALSRGAEKVTFLEKDRLALETIKKNLKLLNCLGKGEVFAGDALAKVREWQSSTRTWDVIYVDPPYKETCMVGGKRISFANRILQLVDEGSLLAKGGTLFLEDRDLEKEGALKHLQFKKKRRVGPAILREFVHRSEEEDE